MAEVDTDRFSRQLYAVGMGAMRRTLAARFCVAGLDGCGMEVAKNITLGGCRALALHDSTPASWLDMSDCCFVTEAHVAAGAPRSSVAVQAMQSLDPALAVSVVDDCSPAAFAAAADVCVLVNPHDWLPSGPGQDKDADHVVPFVAALREAGVHVTVVDTAGVYSRIVNDFGPRFEVADPSGDDPERRLALEIAADPSTPDAFAFTLDVSDSPLSTVAGEPVLVSVTRRCSDGAVEHKAQAVVLSRSGAKTLTLSFTRTPASRETGEVAAAVAAVAADPAASATTTIAVTDVVVPAVLDFAPYGSAEAEERTVFSFVNGTNDAARCLFSSLHRFQRAHGGSRPDPAASSDLDAFSAVAAEEAGRAELSLSPALASLFAATAKGRLAAFSAFVAGIAAQEAVKAASRKFHPLLQTMYWDCAELLTHDAAEGPRLPEDWSGAPVANRYAGQLLLLGKAAHDRVLNATAFIVGAGALGCEYLKNLALAGVGAGPRGRITVTDHDSIERSNLCRQFLFRSGDIGRNKAAAAAGAVKAMAPKVKVRTLSNKVDAASTEPVAGLFNRRFWEQQAAVCTAVDNVAARQLLDDQCVRYRRAMVDAGTLGPRGHVELFAPHVTGRFRDTPSGTDAGQKIPMCTLHFFPTRIEHCVQYAADAFARHYSTVPTAGNKCLASASVAAFLTPRSDDGPDVAETALDATSALVDRRPTSFDDALSWARTVFENTFVHPVLRLLHAHPSGSDGDDGKPYWGGARKLPVAPSFSTSDADHLSFVATAAWLLCRCYGVDAPPSAESAVAAARDSTTLPTVVVPPFVPPPSGADDVKDKEDQEKDAPPPVDNAALVADLKVQLEAAVASWPCGEDGPQPLHCDTFEKDDDTNGHVAFVTAAANIRAATYNIPATTVLDCKRIAGRIVPAMITTTAAVTGLASMAVLRLLAAASEADGFARTAVGRNAAVNLAQVDMTQAFEPTPPAKRCLFTAASDAPPADPAARAEVLRGCGTFTSWDRLEVAGTEDTTIREVVAAVAEKYGGLVVRQLVEDPSGTWVFNAMTDASSLDFPLAGWTQRCLGISEEALAARKACDYVVHTDAPEHVVAAGLKPHPELPVLRFTFASKRPRARAPVS